MNISTGAGAGSSYGPSVLVMATYFEKRRALANGIAITSASLGSFCFPPLIQYCLDYYGLQGTFIITAGITAHVCAAAMLYRQPGFLFKQVLVEAKDTSSKTIANVQIQITRAAPGRVDITPYTSDRRTLPK